jgi:hypothetical protein
MRAFLTISCFSLWATSLMAMNTFVDKSDNAPFPRTPNTTETPGKLCSSPSSIRYPEKIPYCERNVDVYMKQDVIKKYDQDLGYRIETMSRSEFKIDHLIPLCAGGANHQDNLWPQHKSVYAITDPVEPLICLKMQQGKLLQKDAIALVIYAKTHLSEIPSVLAKLNAL